MKKILFAAVNLDIGGIESSLVSLLNYLANNYENEYKITLALEKKQGLFLNALNENIEIIEYTPNNNKIVFVRKLINMFKQMKFKAKYKNKFDFSCAYATYSLPASFIARTVSQNSALWVHSEYMNALDNNLNEYINFYNNIKAYKFRKIIFVSNQAKNIFVDTFKYNNKEYKNIQERAELIHNLINYKNMIEKSEEPISDIEKTKTYTFLNVGRHTEEDKKISRIIKAAKKLNEQGKKFRIVLIGTGNQTEKYKEKIKRENLDETIILLGKKENPYPYYKIADCFLLTSEYEGFPVVYTECMAFGLPMITTEVSDSKEIIENKFGVVVKKDIDAICNAMKQAIEEGISCNEKFDYEQYNKEIIEKVDKLINN